ncbi:MAG: homoserine dehydrogenase [Oscillospiraceae bacterium]|nr:homoserine dehydrogenase [Oscillospiraceae bacterium]
MSKNTMHIALLGFGTVGGGLYEYVSSREDLTVTHVLSRRPRPELSCIVTDDFSSILSDPQVQIVVETIGGLEPAYSYVKAALLAGKHVVTANKLLIATHYRELVELAEKMSVTLRCTAAVGGGIPWLSNLSRTVAQEPVTQVGGIMNGTTNFILDRMHSSDVQFSEVLKEAQALGYAEADPSSDLNGQDICRKLVISANIAFGCVIEEEAVDTFGIGNLSAQDIQVCKSMGRVCKMMACARDLGDKVAAYIEPAFLHKSLPEASIPLNYNQISLVGKNIGTQSFFGQGAGRYPTAYNVLQDCVEICNGATGFYTNKLEDREIDNSSVLRCYYVKTDRIDTWLQKQVVKILDQGVLTKPVSVTEMHTWAKEHPSCFFASIRD